MNPPIQRELEIVMDPATSLGQLADSLLYWTTRYVRLIWDHKSRQEGLTAELRAAGLLVDALHARLHECLPCASGCRRQVWPAVGELCEECFKREEEREKPPAALGYFCAASDTWKRIAAAKAAGVTIGPYVKVAPGVYDEPTKEGWSALAAAEARGRAAGLREAEKAARNGYWNATHPVEEATYDRLANWLNRRAAELEQAGEACAEEPACQATLAAGQAIGRAAGLREAEQEAARARRECGGDYRSLVAYSWMLEWCRGRAAELEQDSGAKPEPKS